MKGLITQKSSMQPDLLKTFFINILHMQSAFGHFEFLQSSCESCVIFFCEISQSCVNCKNKALEGQQQSIIVKNLHVKSRMHRLICSEVQPRSKHVAGLSVPFFGFQV